MLQKPRSNNQTSRSLPVSKSSRVTITAVPKADHSKSSSSFSDSKNFVCSTCHRCVFNANHDACITKLLKEVNSRAKIQSNKTTNSNKPIDQKSHTQKPSRQIFTGHRFSPNKTFAVSEKTSPRSDLRWKPTGRIFKSVGLRWIPTGKLFDSCTSKVDSEPPHGSNVDIPHIHECKQTLDVSAGTSINVQKEQSLDLSAVHITGDLQFSARDRAANWGCTHNALYVNCYYKKTSSKYATPSDRGLRVCKLYSMSSPGTQLLLKKLAHKSLPAFVGVCSPHNRATSVRKSIANFYSPFFFPRRRFPGLLEEVLRVSGVYALKSESM
ncbi:hypothetical protein Tco_0655269 [Tanacetum coccineum]|uniref:Uncharacterized protein n=1 Tax=Tanacetum coccineum TaxID=301880 RepID=A0ABQ4X664_9ASTR